MVYLIKLGCRYLRGGWSLAIQKTEPETPTEAVEIAMIV
jgi:hypothetical protein